jgi:hypothetical protein
MALHVTVSNCHKKTAQRCCAGGSLSEAGCAQRTRTLSGRAPLAVIIVGIAVIEAAGHEVEPPARNSTLTLRGIVAWPRDASQHSYGHRFVSLHQ